MSDNRFAIWPDGTSCHIDELESFSHMSDDYQIVEVDDTFDLEKQITGDSDDDSRTR